jgi:glutamine cyclotransferase
MTCYKHQKRACPAQYRSAGRRRERRPWPVNYDGIEPGFTFNLFKVILIVFAFASCALSQSSPPEVKPRILKVINHQSAGFTQGLFVHKENLYEGTGLYKSSAIHIINPENGSVVKSVPLKKYFGEGITLFNQNLIQLTWKSGRALVYSFPELKVTDTLQYKGEGWGLTSDTASLIMSNGSDTLYFRDSTFRILRRVLVKANGYPVKHLNELEYAKGKIYANILNKKHLVEIDPADGKVLRIIDCKHLFDVEKPPSPRQVLNGVAYNPENGTFYLTGKLWKHIFEVSIPEAK